ncbi:MAG TPA: glycosyltransferase [Chthoniobacterales bacterium]
MRVTSNSRSRTGTSEAIKIQKFFQNDKVAPAVEEQAKDLSQDGDFKERNGADGIGANGSRSELLSAKLDAVETLLEKQEELLQRRAAEASDALTKFVENSPTGYDTIDRDPLLQIHRLKEKLLKQSATIEQLSNWCKDMGNSIPLSLASRKARREFEKWKVKYKTNFGKPLPAPMSVLRAEAEARVNQSVRLRQELKAAESTIRDFLLEVECEMFYPRGEVSELRELMAPAGTKSAKRRGGPRFRDFSCGRGPRVSVIIPVHNQFGYTLGCLRSLSKIHEKTPFEVIIVDDFSDDIDAGRMRGLGGIRLIRNTENLGFIGSCNRGAAAAQGDYLVFLNNDTKVTEGWLDSLMRTFESRSDAGLVGSKLLYSDGTLQEAGGIIWRDGSGWNYGRGDNPSKPEYNYLRETDYCSGACIMMPRQLFEKLGGFDTRFVPAYYEDTDLAFQVRNAGFKVYYQPASQVIHFEGKSNGTSITGGIKKYQVVNFSKFRDKWKTTLDSDHFDNPQHVFRARDRSRNRKTVVVIDHYVPCPDCDAGSRSTMHYIRLFCDLGYNVKFIGNNFAAPQPYTSQLEQLGVEVLHGDWYARHINQWLEEKADQIDFIFANRSHITIKYLGTFKRMRRTRILYYGHDLGSVRNQRHFEITGDAAALSRAEKETELETQIWNAAHAIYYPSVEETAIVKARVPGANARTIPLLILEPKESRYEDNCSDRRDLIFVGGFGHKPNEDGVLWFIENCWPKISATLPDVRFWVVGSKPTPAIKRCASERVIITGWISDDELKTHYQNARVAVVPLRYGAGVKGKVVEALHNHLPIVMTSIAAEGLPGTAEFCGVIDDAESFANTVITFYNLEPANLSQIANLGTDYIRSHFSTKAAAAVVARDLDNTLAGNHLFK